MKTMVKIAAAAALMTMGTAAMATTELVTNGGFELSSATTKTKFGSANVTGWSIDKPSSLTYVDTPGTADNGQQISVYGPFPATSPAGGNFVEMDGDPTYSSTISQVITGLTIGQSYVLNFYQAAGQQDGYTGSTTEQWQVSFGNQSQLSSLFSLPQGGIGAWQAQSMTFTASAVTQTLSFLALGTPSGKPPVAFLDGVSLQAVAGAVPEPAAWTMMILGFGAVGTTMRRRRAGASALA